MKKQSARMALCGIMCALGVVLMTLGGVIPLATFCCPALAALVLVPIMIEAGRGMALGAYASIALLSLLLTPDKEAALLFAFLGYYPVLKPTLDRISKRPIRILAKLAVFDGAAAAMLALIGWVLNWQAILAEYAQMSSAMLAAFILLANVTMLAFDRLLTLAPLIYIKKLRPKLKGL